MTRTKKKGRKQKLDREPLPMVAGGAADGGAAAAAGAAGSGKKPKQKQANFLLPQHLRHLKNQPEQLAQWQQQMQQKHEQLSQQQKQEAQKQKQLKKQQKQQPKEEASEDEEEDDESSSGDDSDAEIGLTADENVKATVKPIAADAPQLISAAEAKAASEAAQAAKKAAKKTAGQKRKATAAAAEDDDEDDDDDGSDAGEGGADNNELIDVEFGLYDPKPLDYLTLKMLLKDYVHGTSGAAAGGKKKKKKAAAAAAMDEDGDSADEDGAPAAAAAAAAPVSSDDFPVHELCAALSSQPAVGSTLKGEGTDEPLGFLSLLNLAWQETHARSEQSGAPVTWVSYLRKYVLRHTPVAQRPTMEAALRDPSTGLLIQSRLLNAPPQMVPHLHQALLDDLAWATTNASLPGGDSYPASAAPSNVEQATKAYRDSFKCKQLLFIGRTFRPAPGAAGGKKAQQPQQQFVSPFASKKKQKQAAGQSAGSAPTTAAGGGEEFEWLRFEEELYARAATLRFSVACPFTSEDAAAGRVPQRCEFMLLPYSALPSIVQQLHLMAAES